jgi:hypothetical protein
VILTSGQVVYKVYSLRLLNPEKEGVMLTPKREEKHTQKTQLKFPEEATFQQHRCDNLKYR